MQRLALVLTSYEATTFLIGEYAEGEHDSAVFTVADGLLWLYQAVDRNSVVRKLQVMKMRGQGQIPGLHTARITDTGVSVFPRLLKPAEVITEHPLEHRLSTGVKGLDEMMGGGVPGGYSVLIAGPSGSGKTVLSNQFIIEGAQHGETGVVAIFEKRPNDYLQTTPRGEEFEKLVREKKLEVLYLRPLDLSIDETLLELQDAVKRLGAKRAVIDSLSGLELALAPTFREDFRESLYRMMGALTGLGVTVMATVELEDSYTDLRFSPQGIAFLTDAIIMQRYVEIDAQLRRALAVVKVRSSEHSKELREYEISSDGGIVIGRALKGYEGLLTGTPTGGGMSESMATQTHHRRAGRRDDRPPGRAREADRRARAPGPFRGRRRAPPRRPETGADRREPAGRTGQGRHRRRGRTDGGGRSGADRPPSVPTRSCGPRETPSDRKDGPQSTEGAAGSARARTLLEHERADADAALERERAARKLGRAESLAVERGTTDKDLTGERAHADTVLVDQREANAADGQRDDSGARAGGRGRRGQGARRGERARAPCGGGVPGDVHRHPRARPA